MGGFDLADQRISYYQPDLRCRRNWIPMFIQILSIIRNNSFIVYHSTSTSKSKKLSHKEFTLKMIKNLIEHAMHNYEGTTTHDTVSMSTISTQKNLMSPPQKIHYKKTRISMDINEQ